MAPVYEMPAIIRKEFRNIIVVKIMSLIFWSNKKTCRKMYNLLSEYFHGTLVIKSHLDLLLSQEGCYGPMFVTSTVAVTDATAINGGNTTTNTEYIIGKHITKSVLESKTGKTAKATRGLASGRMLSDISVLVLKNTKKTLAVLQQMPEVVSINPHGVEMKSGVSKEECKLKLLQLMFITLKGKEDFDDEDDAVDDNNIPASEIIINNDNTRPVDWCYPGWMAFCLFGPFAIESERLTILNPNSKKSDTDVYNGRAKTRLQDKLESNIARHKDMTNKRGVSYELKLGIANMEIKSEILKQQKKGQKNLQLYSAIQIMQQNIDRSEKSCKSILYNLRQ